MGKAARRSVWTTAARLLAVAAGGMLAFGCEVPEVPTGRKLVRGPGFSQSFPGTPRTAYRSISTRWGELRATVQRCRVPEGDFSLAYASIPGGQPDQAAAACGLDELCRRAAALRQGRILVQVDRRLGEHPGQEVWVERWLGNRSTHWRTQFYLIDGRLFELTWEQAGTVHDEWKVNRFFASFVIEPEAVEKPSSPPLPQ